MADNKENIQVNENSTKVVIKDRINIKLSSKDEETPQNAFQPRDPLKTLTNKNAENCLAGPSQKINAKLDTRFVTYRNNDEELDWHFEVFNDNLNKTLFKYGIKDERYNFDENIEPGPSKGGGAFKVTPVNYQNTPAGLSAPKKVKKSLKRPSSRGLQDAASPVSDKAYNRTICSNSKIRGPVIYSGSSFDYLNQHYAFDNLHYMLEIEKKIVGGPKLRKASRSCVINWIINVNGSSGNPAVVQVACWYLDSYLSVNWVTVNRLQVIAAACFWIASKQQHGRSVSARRLVKFSGHAFVEKEVIATEKNILRKLNFPTLPVVPHDFVPYLSGCCDHSGSGVIEAAAVFICQCGVMVDKLLTVEYPSVVAAAAVMNALILLRKNVCVDKLKASSMTKQYDDCLRLCMIALEDRIDRMIEFIRLRVMTIQAKIAGNGYEEVDYFSQQDELATTAVAKTPRAGTTFHRAVTSKTSQTNGRSVATATLRSRGVSSTARSRSARTALFTAYRASRAATALAGGAPFTAGTPLSLRFLSKDDNGFVPAAKTLFEYVYYCEGDVRKAMDVAAQAQKADNTPDWWWKFSIARCYYALGMYRNAEDCLRHALKLNKHISIYLRLVAMYVGLNQPLSALEVCKQGLSVFHEYTPLLLEQARIHDQMGNQTLAVKEYRKVALEDPSNMEAVASIAMHNFYNDQPEIALRYYRRLLATSPAGSEIYNNLGLCCLYCNQWDLILPCFRQALFYSSTPEVRADMWFNLSHVALSTGDMALARRCLQVSLAIHSEHEAARQALRALDARMRARKMKK